MAPFALSSTHGFDQGLIWGSFVDNATTEIRLIYCNGPFWPWNEKNLGCTENLKDTLPHPQEGKREKKGKVSNTFLLRIAFLPLTMFSVVIIFPWICSLWWLSESHSFLLDPQPAVGNMQVWRAKYWNEDRSFIWDKIFSPEVHSLGKKSLKLI